MASAQMSVCVEIELRLFGCGNLRGSIRTLLRHALHR